MLLLFWGQVITCLVLWMIKSANVSTPPADGRMDTSSLNDRLEYFEIIKIDRRIVKRGTDPAKLERIIFRAFNRLFDLRLTPKKGILHVNFRCREIDAYGIETSCTVDPDEHFEGHVHGANDSTVSLTFGDEGSLLGSVRVDGETYLFEPAKIHFASAGQQQILAYRSSDLKLNNGPFCSAISLGNSFGSSQLKIRHKRSSLLPVQKNRFCPWIIP
ncbi:unnamed protein product [Gongylonema pulchrum]|uniref:Pep_M12B_propep domain-containing protein n=1 Tax=Gongylonema pulchrum TaxID=637853 RepID=A0A183CX85_9BILA|nr:unnamed protein product [Gongylonema pulchrum]